MKKYVLTHILVFATIFSTLGQNHMNYVPGEVLIRLENDGNLKTILANFQTFEGQDTNLEIDRLISKHLKIWLLRFNPTLSHQRFLDALYMDDNISETQLNHIIELRTTTPNDVGFGQQWQYFNTGQSGGTPGADMDAGLAWDVTTGGVTPLGDTIVVAVIDEGFDITHPDFGDNIWKNYHEIPNNGIDDDNNGFIDDYHGWNVHQNNDIVTNGGWHGTAVAGIVGAKGNNGTGVTGMNWNVKIMLIRLTNTVESDVLEAYNYTLQNRMRYNQTNGASGAFVVATNASWGINQGQPSQAPLWCAFYDTLGVHGILNAGATANSNLNVDVVGDLPTACASDYMISVTNINHNDQKVMQAGYGTNTIDLGAFGEGTWTVDQGGGYDAFGGTSGATPHVAGMIGLLYSVPCVSLALLSKTNPDSAALLMKQFIMDGTDANTSLQGISVSGGRLNMKGAIEEMLDACTPSSVCVPPFSLNTTYILDTFIILNWGAIIDTATNFNIQYRIDGTPTWTNITFSDSNFVYRLNGLTPCTTYQIQMEMDCDTTTSGFSNILTFKTDGCCEPPTGLVLTNATDSTANLNWNSILAALSYDLRYRPIGTTSWIDVTGLTSTTYNFTGLELCTAYEVEIKTNCLNDTTIYGSTFIFSSHCGSCSSLPYCSSNGNAVSDEWIQNVQFADINNNSGIGTTGYTDFTNLSTTVLKGYTYPITLSQGYSGTPYTEHFAVWIDYNQNANFEASELVYASGGTITTPNIGNVKISSNATLGPTRMRVSMRYNAVPLACQSFNYGEVEDYCVNIQDPGTTCSAISNLDTTVVNEMDATLIWASISNSISYTIGYKIRNNNIWTTVTTTDTMYQLTNLEAGQPYEAYVIATCASNFLSDTSNKVTFDTDWTVGTSDLPSDVTGCNVYPNPFRTAMQLVIHVASRQDITIELYDLSGKSVVNTQLHTIQHGKNNINIATEHLSNGIYILKIKTEKGIIIKQVVKA